MSEYVVFSHSAPADPDPDFGRVQLTDGLQYCVPQLYTKFSERAFSRAGHTTWNALVDNMHTMADSVKFRNMQKSHSFTTAFNISWQLFFRFYLQPRAFDYAVHPVFFYFVICAL